MGPSALAAAFKELALSNICCQNRCESAYRSEPAVPTARAGSGAHSVEMARMLKYSLCGDAPIRKFDNISSAVLIYFSILEIR